MARPEKMTRVMTWKARPAMEMSTAVLLPPELLEDMAPPEAWRTREMTSQTMKM